MPPPQHPAQPLGHIYPSIAAGDVSRFVDQDIPETIPCFIPQKVTRDDDHWCPQPEYKRHWHHMRNRNRRKFANSDSFADFTCDRRQVAARILEASFSVTSRAPVRQL